MWWVLLDEGSCEVGPGCEVTEVDRLAPSGDGWAETACMVKCNSVCCVGCIMVEVVGRVVGGMWWWQLDVP